MKKASEMTRDELLIENQRLRGDLLTIAYRISHDLRTPLGAISVSCETLLEILTATDPSALPLAAAALTSTEEMLALIKTLSFLTKATGRPIASYSINMSEVVFAVLNRLERKIQILGASIAKVDVWPPVKGVAEWLEVIWRNILLNALQHAGTSPKIQLGWKEEKEQYKFWVADNGPGVPPEGSKKLFQPFDQLHQTNAAHGLGLAVVQRLVELQEGVSGYELTPDGGPCFYFTLPTHSSKL